LAHFDAEELGMVGSGIFVDHSPVPLDSIALMINLDMVGRMEDGGLFVEVTSPAEPLEASIDSIAGSVGLSLRPRSIAGRSDHSSFSRQEVPAIALFTGFHGDYHEATDTPDKLDVPGILRVVDLAEAHGGVG
jgi:Zn-dependent M28 family amino/carboxypeptidase